MCVVPERIVIPVSPEVAIVKSSAFACPSVVVPKSNLPLESMRSLSVGVIEDVEPLTSCASV